MRDLIHLVFIIGVQLSTMLSMIKSALRLLQIVIDLRDYDFHFSTPSVGIVMPSSYLLSACHVHIVRPCKLHTSTIIHANHHRHLLKMDLTDLSKMSFAPPAHSVTES